MARELTTLGPGTLVAKLGALGALSLVGDAVYTAPAAPPAVGTEKQLPVAAAAGCPYAAHRTL